MEQATCVRRGPSPCSTGPRDERGGATTCIPAGSVRIMWAAMPTYEYQAEDPQAACAHCRSPFEVRQAMRAAPLKVCPQCGARVVRLISRCGISTSPSGRSMLSDRNLKAKGFTKLVNEGGGKFRKVT